MIFFPKKFKVATALYLNLVYKLPSLHMILQRQDFVSYCYEVRFINKFPYSIKSKPSKLYGHEIWDTEGSNLLGIRNEILWLYVERIQNSIYFSEVRWSKMAGIIESSPAHQNFSRYDIRVIIKFSVIFCYHAVTKI